MPRRSDRPPIHFLFSGGFTQRFYTPGYGSAAPIMEAAANAGMVPHWVDQDWIHGNPDAWKDKMVQRACNVAGAGGAVVLGGFSFGAPIAIRAAVALDKQSAGPIPLGVVGASTSPVFDGVYGEFQRRFPDEHEGWLSTNPNSTRGYGNPLPHLDLPVQLYAGRLEVDTVKISTDTVASALDATVVEIPRTRHDILDKEYVATIAKNLGGLIARADTTNYAPFEPR